MPQVVGLDILAGDFNCVEDPADKSGSWRPTPSVRELALVLDEAGMVDSMPVGNTHTWHGHNASARIDRVYGKEDSDLVLAVQCLPSTYGLSDHKGLVIDVTGADLYGRGGGFWRAQQCSLDSRALVGRLQGHVEQWAKWSDRMLHGRWDEVKGKLAETMKGFEKSVRREQEEASSEGKIDGAMKGVPLSVTTGSPTLAQSDYLEKEARRRKEAFVRAKDARRELPDQFLTAQVKQEVSERTIRAIQAEDGSIKTQQHEIISTMTDHFQRLYSARPVDHGLAPHCITLPAEVTHALGEKMTVQEGIGVTTTKSPTSAPGPDGLPYRVYSAVPGLMELLI